MDLDRRAALKFTLTGYLPATTTDPEMEAIGWRDLAEDASTIDFLEAIPKETLVAVTVEAVGAVPDGWPAIEGLKVDAQPADTPAVIPERDA